MTPDVTWCPSPNFGPRRDGLTPKLVVLHYTEMTTCEAARTRLSNPKAEVSAHYLISEKGEILQLVEESKRAWHAGAGEWHGQDDINSRSIGIELDNTGQTPFSEPLMAALEDLLPGILDRWSIPPEGVIGHSDMAPGRKVDPGPRFDWHRLARQGLAAQNTSVFQGDDHSPTAFRALAWKAGYTSDVDDQTLLNAVRLRHRPWAQGPLTVEDFAPLWT